MSFTHDKDTAILLVQLLDELLYDSDSAAEHYRIMLADAGMEPERASVRSFEDVGMMTLNAGVVIQDRDSQIQLVVHTR